MANVNCPLCKGAVWIPAEKAAQATLDELAKFLASQPATFTGHTLATTALKWEKSMYDAAAILGKYEVRRR